MTEDTETVTCPAEGCDYDGFRKSVLGHYSGRQDGEHAGGYQRAKTLLAGGDTDTDTVESDDTPDQSGGNGSGSPVMGSADPDGPPDTDTSGVELPCGHESYDPGEAPDPPFAVSCSQCGKAWEVKE